MLFTLSHSPSPHGRNFKWRGRVIEAAEAVMETEARGPMTFLPVFVVVVVV